MSTATLVIIPARGGSKGIARKNVRSLAGRPLLSYAVLIARASRHAPDVFVSTDDDEIAMLARRFGAAVHRRDSALADDATTLDEVVVRAVPEIERQAGRRYDVVVTQQPTSPLLRVESLDRAIDRLIAERDVDTLISAVEDTHLTWRLDGHRFIPDYQERVNRQFLPPRFRETGGFLVARRENLDHGSRLGRSISVALLDGPEAIDIDTPDDWGRCEWHLGRRSILLAVTGSRELGLGHVHNALIVAGGLTNHRVSFLVDRRSKLARDAIAAFNYDVEQARSDDLVGEILARRPDVVINDRLDTTAAEIRRLKEAGLRVVNFEDLGSGAAEADLVINAIYPEPVAGSGHHSGWQYFVARDEFIHSEPRPLRSDVDRVLITFGGADPSDLTSRVGHAIAPVCQERDIDLEIIAGRGYRHHERLADIPGAKVHRSVANMSEHMRRADVVITSAGRTVFEVACLGVPAIVLAQNERELTHLFATEERGFLNLGIGSVVSDERIVDAFLNLVDDAAARRSMQERQLSHDLRSGRDRVLRLIERVVETP